MPPGKVWSAMGRLPCISLVVVGNGLIIACLKRIGHVHKSLQLSKYVCLWNKWNKMFEISSILIYKAQFWKVPVSNLIVWSSLPVIMYLIKWMLNKKRKCIKRYIELYINWFVMVYYYDLFRQGPKTRRW